MTRVATGPLRGSDKSGGKRVARLLCSSGKSANKAAARQWQEWWEESGKRDKSGRKRVARVTGRK